MDFWRGWPYPVAVATLFAVALLRAGATYALGRAAQTGARRTRIARLMARPGFARVQDLVARWGAPLVTASFLTVGIQTLVNLVAGMTQMPLRRYLPALALGSLLWGFLYATVGFATFSAWRELYRGSRRPPSWSPCCWSPGWRRTCCARSGSGEPNAST